MEVRDGQVLVQNPKSSSDEPPKSFTYDQVYGGESQQLELFSITAKPIVESVMAGYNGTIFAYGQTGTGVVSSMRLVPGLEQHAARDPANRILQARRSQWKACVIMSAPSFGASC